MRQNIFKYCLDEINIALLVFRSEERDPDLFVHVHGGDHFAVGTRTELFAFGENIDDKFRINLIGMVSRVCERSAIKFLKTVSKFKHELGFSWRGDERHVIDILTLFNLERCKASETFCMKDTVKNLSNAEDELNHEEAKRLQSGVGNLMYHSVGRPSSAAR